MGDHIDFELAFVDPDPTPPRRRAVEPRPVDCPGCGTRFTYPTDRAGCYCTDWCYDAAKHVRKYRRWAREGRLGEPSIAGAVRKERASLMGGGYPATARKVPKATKDAVRERDGWLCRSCGDPGVEIDHVDGDSNDPANLQLLCVPCHDRKTEASMRVMTGEELAEKRPIIEDLEARCAAAEPLRPCDVDGWDWRGWIRRRA